MELIKKDTPISLENAGKLLPLIEEQAGFEVATIETKRESHAWTYHVRKTTADDSATWQPSGLRFESRECALRSACRLLLGRSGDLQAWLDQQGAGLARHATEKAEKRVKGLPQKEQAAAFSECEKEERAKYGLE